MDSKVVEAVKLEEALREAKFKAFEIQQRLSAVLSRLSLEQWKAYQGEMSKPIVIGRQEGEG